MAWAVEWDNNFIIGGSGHIRLSPNFRLREFANAAGEVRVHRELASGLQILRDRLARPIKIESVDSDGLGATVRAESLQPLAEQAASIAAFQLQEHGLSDGADSLQLRIDDPTQLPAIELEQALETAFAVTSGFETSGDRFTQVTGNFDGAGLSFGPMQWNFLSNTLVPLFRKFQQRDSSAFSACFTDPDDLQEWLDVMEMPKSRQIRWADGISTGRGNHDVVQPWKGYLKAVGRVQAFRSIMVEQALRKYGAKLLVAVNYLQTLAPHVEISHLRCLCALYDLVIQQGSLNKARSNIERRVELEQPDDQFALVGIAVDERGLRANPRWQADCRSRRLGILHGVPTTIDGRQRANIKFYMLRDVKIRDAPALVNADVTEQLLRVSDAIAAGGSLLA